VEHSFGRSGGFTLGVEEELLLVDPSSHALAHEASAILERVAAGAHAGEGWVSPDTYEALVELASPICASAPQAREAIAGLRGRVREAGGEPIGAGIHPDGAFGDVRHVDSERYRCIADSMRGLLRRTPTCALHVHVGMPDADTAIRVFNRLRAYLPLLQGLAANSPFWHGKDSGLASARSALFRGYPRAEVPRAFADFDDYADTVQEVVAAGELEDYTFLWWDVRPHPRLGTVEVRAMDSQSRVSDVAALSAFVHALAVDAAQRVKGEQPPRREALAESSFRASRDGLDASILHDGGLRPLREVAAATLARARPIARDLGGADELDGIERILREGNGADRQRAALAGGGMRAVLRGLVAETREG
jgi:carboxylate-amine ligase